MLRIYIPTLNRVGKQVTFNNLPPKLQANAVLVVPAAERKAHGDTPVIAHPAKCTSIGHVRQWIVDQHDVDAYGSKIIMLDDDLNFYKRRKDDIKKFEPVEPKDMLACFKEVEGLLKQYAHVGIRHREMAQDAATYQINTRALRALAYNVDVLRKHKVKFNRIIVMEDFDVTLQLLRLGLPNVVISSYIQNQGSSNAAGGCSTYRTLERQKEGADGLKKLHPDFVKLVTKQTKTAWGGGERTDVVVSWKKAYESSRASGK